MLNISHEIKESNMMRSRSGSSLVRLLTTSVLFTLSSASETVISFGKI